MEKSNKKIVVLGAGISGLASAYWLFKEGLDVTILEASGKPGGSMQTETEDGFLIDYGPNSGLETTPLIRQLAKEVGLDGEMIYANKSANKRYILKKDSLIPLPMNPVSFLKTKLFSPASKLRLLKEPLIGRSSDGYNQSIAEFVRRRLGKQFLNYAIDPFVSGVFAGDPEKLSVKSAFPKLYRLEEEYGGLIKGMIKGAKERNERNEESKQSAKMFSFINGMQSFPETIANKLKNKIYYNCRIEKVVKNEQDYIINCIKKNEELNFTADVVLSTIPAYTAGKIFKSIDNDLPGHLDSIFYPPVIVLYLGYRKDDINRPLDGFGFLIPSLEKKNFLGAIWSSTIFENRAAEGFAAFTLFIGGAKVPEVLNNNKEVTIATAIKEFSQIMGIESKPVLVKEKSWNKAIPQYNIGYIDHEIYFDKFEKENPGIYLGGNYRGGISVGDCIKNSKRIAENIAERVNNL